MRSRLEPLFSLTVASAWALGNGDKPKGDVGRDAGPCKTISMLQSALPLRGGLNVGVHLSLDRPMRLG